MGKSRLFVIISVLMFSIMAEKGYCYEWGDTLTYIQRPILNVPAIVEPSDTFDVLIQSSQTIDDWQGKLKFDDTIYDLVKGSQVYDNDFGCWLIDFQLPSDIPGELYDLIIYNAEFADTSANAVAVAEITEDYTFAVICDSHIPTVGFWIPPEPDSSVIPDVQAVFADLEIIDPKFVLHLGDLVDQGYLEEYQNRHYMGRAQAVLSECTSPIYMIAGNHDVGGCATPGSPFEDGCARRYWWNYFGWKWLDDPPDNHFTQDYVFKYGDDLFIGMESYQAYDRWREEIYNYKSFCPSAMDWLNQQLINYSNSRNKILFTHWDYSRQIHPLTIGVDMVLMGHLHIDYGSLTAPPYYLSMENVCEHFKSPYGRAYMLVSVENGVLIPQKTLYAGPQGENLQIIFTPGNSGTHFYVEANITNQNDTAFHDALVKINMPLICDSFEVTGGYQFQSITHQEYQTVYIRFDVDANSSNLITVSSEIAFIEELTITISDTNIVLTWEEIPGAILYNIYRSDSAYFEIPGMTPIAQTDELIYIDDQVVSFNKSFYRVTWEYLPWAD